MHQSMSLRFVAEVVPPSVSGNWTRRGIGLGLISCVEIVCFLENLGCGTKRIGSVEMMREMTSSQKELNTWGGRETNDLLMKTLFIEKAVEIDEILLQQTNQSLCRFC